MIAIAALFGGAYMPSRIFAVIWIAGVVAAGGYVGYWLDRTLFKNARPNAVDSDCRCAAWQRRAIVIGASMIAMAIAAGGAF